MKVLFIGHYNETSGWGQGIRDYIIALHRAGVDVACRPIKLGTPDPQLPQEILECQDKDIRNRDVCIQFVLPHHMSYNGNFKNIGMFYNETIHLNYTSWFQKLQLMDELWVPNVSMMTDLQECHGNINVVHQPVNFDKYLPYFPLDLPPCRGNYVFYFIGDFTIRKRMSALIRAFHSEFTPNEPVSLVLKCNKHGMDENQLVQELDNQCNKIKHGLKLYHNDTYHKEVFITRYLSDEDLLRLHALGDCFVMPSYGEAVCLPIIDALMMGSNVIANNTGGVTEIPEVKLCDNNWEHCFGMNDTFGDINTGREYWDSIDVIQLQECMRQMYERRPDVDKKMIQTKFSYEMVGSRMKDLLNAKSS